MDGNLYDEFGNYIGPELEEEEEEEEEVYIRQEEQDEDMADAEPQEGKYIQSMRYLRV
eukprot:TRINITY_DN1263_c0_g1_i2.p2 TRINITY_DN1263_c0_g1~~TRINITY_DN1263_c0_g1_i2.p2  ORF type:complete len:58 (-),score=20.99 TRINITY_DN1263_c0_g1_i2:263-436(-)